MDSSPSSSLNRIWKYDVFPSFQGEDVRRGFLSYVQEELQMKGIALYNNYNGIERSNSNPILPIRTIRRSKIAVIVLSKNYVSSSRCLDELAEIMKCKRKFGQKVMVIYPKEELSDVWKLTRDFGKAFRKTCVFKTKKTIRKWKKALLEVATNSDDTITRYHSSNWYDEAAMIKNIATDIEVFSSTPSSDLNRLVGMEAHLEKMEEFLCTDSDDVRMIGIWGPSGIGKTTIARFVFNKYKLSNRFQLSVFTESIKTRYPRPYLDEYSAKLHLQEMLSKMFNQKDVHIARDHLRDKKVLLILDNVDSKIQLDALVKDIGWFGPGSRIIITTQNPNLLEAHKIYPTYHVGLPPIDQALQIFCKYTFDQDSPLEGFEELALKIIEVSGKLPLVLKSVGLYLRGKSKEEWRETLTRLRYSNERTEKDKNKDTGFFNRIFKYLPTFVKPRNIQVFINFRGAELRRTFVSHLVLALQNSGINIFIDNHERRGEDVNNLFKRIEGSGIAIVVFSSRYTESDWCLNELVTIKKRVEQGLLKVVPIYYKVDIGNVKHLEGDFGKNFRETEKKHQSDELKIKRWKEAIAFVSNIETFIPILESDVISTVVKEVLEILITFPM